MATTLPTDATKDNSDSVLDDPELAILTDLAGVIDKYNSLKAALGTAAQLNLAEGLSTAAQAGGTPNDLRTHIPVSGKTGAYTITTTDRSKLIRTTGAGGFTLSFTAAATLGDGWFCGVRNDATGTVTLDPNGGETIDGAATRTLDTGQAVLVFCNGSLLVTIGPWNITALEDLEAGSPTQVIDGDNDELLIYDASDSRHKKIKAGSLGALTKEYESGQTSITLSGDNNFTHGLGVRPKFISVELHNVTAQGGYGPGDVVHHSDSDVQNDQFGGGYVVFSDSTTITVRASSDVRIMNKTSGVGMFTLIAANWRWVVRAWA